ncbi:MAG: TetR family transcriptional regulator [Vicinamibacterales bacterium]
MPRTSRTSRRAPASPRRDTRNDIFFAAAEAFSARGFEGVGVDDIARAAGVNKAMIYYHFADKLALYRAIVAEMLTEGGRLIETAAALDGTPEDKVKQFIAAFAELAAARPWFPTMMMREVAEGAPHLDAETLARMRNIFVTFGRLLAEGEAAGRFRHVNPVLAYMSTLGPMVFNAARERAGAVPGRRDLPMFAEVPREELTRHMQETVIRMLAKER